MLSLTSSPTMSSFYDYLPLLPMEITQKEITSEIIDQYIKETELLIKTAAHYQKKKHINEAVLITQNIHCKLTYLLHLRISFMIQSESQRRLPVPLCSTNHSKQCSTMKSGKNRRSKRTLTPNSIKNFSSTFKGKPQQNTDHTNQQEAIASGRVSAAFGTMMGISRQKR